MAPPPEPYDIGNDSPFPHPFPNAGRRTIERMMQNADEDKMTAQAGIDDQIDYRGSPITRRARYRWFSLFVAYVVHIMHQDIRQTPTSILIRTFLYHVVERLQSNCRGKLKVSESTVKEGMTLLIDYFRLMYPDFTWTDNNKVQLDNAYARLRNKGKLQKGKWRQQHWIGFFALRRMLLAYIHDGLVNGVGSWDIRIVRVLSLALMCALNCRVGEIVRSGGYTGNEFLAWGDIVIKFVGGDDFSNLVIEIKLRYEKGSKNDPSSYRRVVCSPLQNPLSFVIDPIFLILVLAMRIGQIEATNWDEIRELMLSRSDRTLPFNRPGDPVIPAINKHTNRLVLHKPAQAVQVEVSLQEAGDAAGIAETLRTHDIRRGSAQDMAMLGQVDAGVDPSVAAAMGHKLTTLHMGTTDMYAGRTSWNILNAKEKAADDQLQDPFGLTMFTEPAPRSELPKRSVVVERKDDGLASYSGAKKDLKGKRRVEWVEEQKTALTVSTAAEGEGRRKKVRSAEDVLKERTDSQLNIIAQTVRRESRASPLKDVSDASDPVNDTEEQEIDEAYVRSLEALALSAVNPGSQSIDPGLEDDEELPDDAEDAEPDEGTGTEEALMTLEAEAELPDDSPLRLDPKLALNHFARLNTFKRSSSWKSENKTNSPPVESGNSRDAPSLFIKRCKYASLGCKKEMSDLSHLTDHEERTCVYRASVRPDQISRHEARLNAIFVCDQCDKRFSQIVDLNRHIKVEHSEWEPKGCDHGCNPKHIFATKGRYLAHMHAYHPAAVKFTPQECDFKDDCGLENHFFTGAQFYRLHLERKHKMTREEVLRIVPLLFAHADTIIAPYKQGPCPIGNCSMSTITITRRQALMGHLMSKQHSLSETDARRIAGGFPIAEVLGKEFAGAAESITAVEASDDKVKSPAKKGFLCPVGNCNQAHKPFPDRKVLRNHLTNRFHGLSEEEANRLSGYVPQGPLKLFHCPCPGCNFTARVRSGLATHLKVKKEHRFSDDEAKAMAKAVEPQEA